MILFNKKNKFQFQAQASNSSQQPQDQSLLKKFCNFFTSKKNNLLNVQYNVPQNNSLQIQQINVQHNIQHNIQYNRNKGGLESLNSIAFLPLGVTVLSCFLLGKSIDKIKSLILLNNTTSPNEQDLKSQGKICVNTPNYSQTPQQNIYKIIYQIPNQILNQISYQQQIMEEVYKKITSIILCENPISDYKNEFQSYVIGNNSQNSSLQIQQTRNKGRSRNSNLRNDTISETISYLPDFLLKNIVNKMMSFILFLPDYQNSKLQEKKWGNTMYYAQIQQQIYQIQTLYPQRITKELYKRKFEINSFLNKRKILSENDAQSDVEILSQNSRLLISNYENEQGNSAENTIVESKSNVVKRKNSEEISQGSQSPKSRENNQNSLSNSFYNSVSTAASYSYKSSNINSEINNNRYPNIDPPYVNSFANSQQIRNNHLELTDILNNISISSNSYPEILNNDEEVHKDQITLGNSHTQQENIHEVIYRILPISKNSLNGMDFIYLNLIINPTQLLVNNDNSRKDNSQSAASDNNNREDTSNFYDNSQQISNNYSVEFENYLVEFEKFLLNLENFSDNLKMIRTIMVKCSEIRNFENNDNLEYKNQLIEKLQKKEEYIKKLNLEIDQYKKFKEEYLTNMEFKNIEIDELIQKINELELIIPNLKEELSSLYNIIQEIERKILELKCENNFLNENVSSLSNQIQKKDLENEKSQKTKDLEIEKIKSRNQELKVEIKILELKDKKSELKIEGLELKNERLESETIKLKLINQELELKFKELKSINQELKSKIEELEQENSKFESNQKNLLTKDSSTKSAVQDYQYLSDSSAKGQNLKDLQFSAFTSSISTTQKCENNNPGTLVSAFTEGNHVISQEKNNGKDSGQEEVKSINGQISEREGNNNENNFHNESDTALEFKDFYKYGFSTINKEEVKNQEDNPIGQASIEVGNNSQDLAQVESNKQTLEQEVESINGQISEREGNDNKNSEQEDNQQDNSQNSFQVTGQILGQQENQEGNNGQTLEQEKINNQTSDQKGLISISQILGQQENQELQISVKKGNNNELSVKEELNNSQISTENKEQEKYFRLFINFLNNINSFIFPLNFEIFKLNEFIYLNIYASNDIASKKILNDTILEENQNSLVVNKENQVVSMLQLNFQLSPQLLKSIFNLFSLNQKKLNGNLNNLQLIEILNYILKNFRNVTGTQAIKGVSKQNSILQITNEDKNKELQNSIQALIEAGNNNQNQQNQELQTSVQEESNDQISEQEGSNGQDSAQQLQTLGQASIKEEINNQTSDQKIQISEQISIEAGSNGQDSTQQVQISIKAGNNNQNQQNQELQTSVQEESNDQISEQEGSNDQISEQEGSNGQDSVQQVQNSVQQVQNSVQQVQILVKSGLMDNQISDQKGSNGQDSVQEGNDNQTSDQKIQISDQENFNSNQISDQKENDNQISDQKENDNQISDQKGSNGQDSTQQVQTSMQEGNNNKISEQEGNQGESKENLNNSKDSDQNSEKAESAESYNEKILEIIHQDLNQDLNQNELKTTNGSYENQQESLNNSIFSENNIKRRSNSCPNLGTHNPENQKKNLNNLTFSENNKNLSSSSNYSKNRSRSRSRSKSITTITRRKLPDSKNSSFAVLNLVSAAPAAGAATLKAILT